MEIFTQLGIVIGITVLIACIMRLLKQPLIVGYIITGIVVSPYFLNIINIDMMTIFSQIGIALLLFIVGLNLSPKVIKEVGKVSLITGIGQIVFTSLIGFLISRMLGFSNIISMYIAVALTFSSTIIVMKLLSDKGDMEKMYGKISIGFLLVQDLAAIIFLIIVPILFPTTDMPALDLRMVAIGVAAIIAFVLTSIFILPKMSKFFAKSQEFLFLFSAGWGLGLAGLFHFLGFSMEIGALIAGVSLSMSPYHYEISSRMKPLRDFFIIIFFIVLGSQMIFDNLTNMIIPAIIFSLFIIIGHPLIMLVIMGILGYKKRVSFQTGMTIAQISEFSLIIIILGIKLGHVTNEILSLITFVGFVTIAGSTYLISYSDKIYPYLAKALSIFERKNLKKTKQKKENYDVILFGCNRIGQDILESFNRLKKKVLVVDYNPEVINALMKKKIRCKYGDADDDEFLSELNLKKVKIVVSTTPDFETNSLIINKALSANKNMIIMAVSHNIKEAEMLYKKGATYVIMPHFLGGKYASMMIDKYGTDISKFIKEKEEHIQSLETKKKMGYEHPKAEKNR